MLSRIMLTYPDGVRTYATIEVEDGVTYLVINKVRYTSDAIKNTGAVITVNDSETLELMQKVGMNARPSNVQSTITISVAPETKELITGVAKRQKTTVSRLIENLINANYKR